MSTQCIESCSFSVIMSVRIKKQYKTVYYNSFQCSLCIPGGSHDTEYVHDVKNYFHNNTEMLFAFFNILTSARFIQKQWQVKRWHLWMIPGSNTSLHCWWLYTFPHWLEKEKSMLLNSDLDKAVRQVKSQHTASLSCSI